MIINCYKCGDKLECNPKGQCWCNELEFKIQKEKISNINLSCQCKKCLIKVSHEYIGNSNKLFNTVDNT